MMIPLSKYNKVEDYDNHWLARDVGNQMLETIRRLGLISSVDVRDYSMVCVIGWVYELR